MKPQYDSKEDILLVDIRDKKVYRSIEFSENVFVDINERGDVIGIEILNASEEISKLFQRVVQKDEIKQLLCHIESKPNTEQLVEFESPITHQRVAYMISLYRSPILS